MRVSEYGSIAGTCPAPDCVVEIPRKHLLCKAHWAMVPKVLQVALVRAYKDGSSATAYLAARKAVLDSITPRPNERRAPARAPRASTSREGSRAVLRAVRAQQIASVIRGTLFEEGDVLRLWVEGRTDDEGLVKALTEALTGAAS